MERIIQLSKLELQVAHQAFGVLSQAVELLRDNRRASADARLRLDLDENGVPVLVLTQDDPAEPAPVQDDAVAAEE